MKRPKSFSRLLNAPGSPLHGYSLMQQRSLRLRRRLNRSLPQELHECYIVGAVKRDVLSLYANNALWATQLRYHAEALLEALHATDEYKTIRSIKIKLLPVHHVPNKTRHPSYSQEASNQMGRVAEEVKDDSLRAALQRLAGHLKSRPPRKKPSGDGNN